MTAADLGYDLPRLDPDADAAIRPVRALHIAQDDELETKRRARRDRLRDQHAGSVSRLLGKRQDLRGVHPLADLVSDSINWSA
jgi:hypothetical protein